jgi:hypothetical protein
VGCGSKVDGRGLGEEGRSESPEEELEEGCSLKNGRVGT